MNKEKLFRIWAKIMFAVMIIIWLDEINVILAYGGYDVPYLITNLAFWLDVALKTFINGIIAVPLAYFGFRKTN